MHLAAAHIEVDAVVRDERAEALGDALQLEGERGGLLGQRDALYGTSAGMSAISPDSILAWTSSTWSAYFSPSAFTSP